MATKLSVRSEEEFWSYQIETSELPRFDTPPIKWIEILSKSSGVDIIVQ
jgi:hypothetical protein